MTDQEMTREAFEQWAKVNVLSITKSDSPACWHGSKAHIERWEKQPYASPYTNGAYCAWLYLEHNDAALREELTQAQAKIDALEETNRIAALAVSEAHAKIAELEAKP